MDSRRSIHLFVNIIMILVTIYLQTTAGGGTDLHEPPRPCIVSLLLLFHLLIIGCITIFRTRRVCCTAEASTIIIFVKIKTECQATQRIII